MKKKPINFNIKLGNKVFYSLITFVILVAVAGIAVAVQNWEVMGHDPNDLGVPGYSNSVQYRLCLLEEKTFGAKDPSCGAGPVTCNPACTTGFTCQNGQCVPIDTGCPNGIKRDSSTFGTVTKKEIDLRINGINICVAKGCTIKFQSFTRTSATKNWTIKNNWAGELNYNYQSPVWAYTGDPKGRTGSDGDGKNALVIDGTVAQNIYDDSGTSNNPNSLVQEDGNINKYNIIEICPKP